MRDVVVRWMYMYYLFEGAVFRVPDIVAVYDMQDSGGEREVSTVNLASRCHKNTTQITKSFEFCQAS